MRTIKEVIDLLNVLRKCIDLEEIEELDIASKSTILQYFDQDFCLPVVKIQAILDYTYERINIGNWKDVPKFLAKTMTISSYVKLMSTLKSTESSLVINSTILKELFKVIDYGLLFGCPLNSNPLLLQNCATKLNEIYVNLPEASTHQTSTIEIPKPTTDISYTGQQIDNLDCPSMEYFYINYITKNLPAVLTNCINHWPAMTKWKDKSYIKNVAGYRTVPIEIGSKYTDADWTQKLMTIEELINQHIDNTENPIGYLAQYQLFNHIPELKNDIIEPDYCAFTENDDAVDINAWFGPKGTVSPLHHDPKRNLLAQVVGEKQIFLFSPSDTAYLYPHDDDLLNNTAQVDPREPNLEKFPDYCQATPYSCILRPGQMLYIPPKWWHFVESLSISFSVSFWWE